MAPVRLTTFKEIRWSCSMLFIFYMNVWVSQDLSKSLVKSGVELLKIFPSHFMEC